MIRGKEMKDIVVTSSSYRVGDVAAHTFTLTTVVPLVDTDQFLVTYPS